VLRGAMASKVLADVPTSPVAQAVEFLGCGVLEDLIQGVEAASGWRVDDHLLQLSRTCSDRLRLGA